MNLEAIRADATAFRVALETCEKATMPIGFSQFPLGSCGDATVLLGTYLTDRGHGVFDYMLGLRGTDRASHAWLQAGNLVVDITADQFPEINSPVIVTQKGEWHALWNGEAQHVADYRIYQDDYTLGTLSAAYGRVLVQIRALESDASARA